MSWTTHKYIVVDEYDNVVGYYATEEEAIAEADAENQNGIRGTAVFKIEFLKEYEEATE